MILMSEKQRGSGVKNKKKNMTLKFNLKHLLLFFRQTDDVTEKEKKCFFFFFAKEYDDFCFNLSSNNTVQRKTHQKKSL